jgi:hypothetical protein
MDLILDVNVDIYPLQVCTAHCPLHVAQALTSDPVTCSAIHQPKEKFSLVLASTISIDGTPETGKYDGVSSHTAATATCTGHLSITFTTLASRTRQIQGYKKGTAVVLAGTRPASTALKY